MKKYAAKYEEDRTEYWPMHDATIAAIVFLSSTSALVLCGAIGIFFSNTTWTNRILMLSIAVAITTFYSFFLLAIKKQMYEKIVFSDNGVEVSNEKKKTCFSFEWYMVSTVQFHTDPWKGATTYRIWFKPETAAAGYSQKKPFIIAINAVNEEKLRRFIPADLLEVTWGQSITSPKKHK